MQTLFVCVLIIIALGLTLLALAIKKLKSNCQHTDLESHLVSVRDSDNTEIDCYVIYQCTKCKHHIYQHTYVRKLK